MSSDPPDPPSGGASSTVLGSNLRRLRSASGLTQAEVARRAGIARPHYAALETGASSNGGPANPRLSTLVDLALALRTTLADVLEGIAP